MSAIQDRPALALYSTLWADILRPAEQGKPPTEWRLDRVWHHWQRYQNELAAAGLVDRHGRVVQAPADTVGGSHAARALLRYRNRRADALGHVRFARRQIRTVPESAWPDMNWRDALAYWRRELAAIRADYRHGVTG